MGKCERVCVCACGAEETDRQTDRQTDRRTDRQRGRCRYLDENLHARSAPLCIHPSEHWVRTTANTHGKHTCISIYTYTYNLDNRNEKRSGEEKRTEEKRKGERSREEKK